MMNKISARAMRDSLEDVISTSAFGCWPTPSFPVRSSVWPRRVGLALPQAGGRPGLSGHVASISQRLRLLDGPQWRAAAFAR